MLFMKVQTEASCKRNGASRTDVLKVLNVLVTDIYSSQRYTKIHADFCKISDE